MPPGFPMSHGLSAPPRDPAAPALPRAPRIGLGPVVALLSLSQIVGYGTVYYAYSIVAPHLARDFGVPEALPFTVISAALLLSGLAGPAIGRLIDRMGPPQVMQHGSIAVAALYLALAAAPGFAVAAVLVVALQVAAVTVLYGAAFPTLALFGPDTGKRGMIWLGLVGGLASSIFWPFAGWLVAAAGWRMTFAVFALLHLTLALPAHMAIARHRIAARPVRARAAAAPAMAASARPVPRRLAFWLVALSFGLTGIVGTALLVHLVPLLAARSPGAPAYAAAALAGPAMLLARLAEALFWPRAHPIWSACIAAGCFPLALAALVAGPSGVAGGALCAILYGIGHGLAVTSGGTLPLRLFGAAGYAELLGRIGAVRVLFGAAGPMALALGLQTYGPTLPALAGLVVALAGLVPLLALALLLFLPRSPAGVAP